MKRNKEHFVTCGQMKILEQRADADGLSYYQMMENAGSIAAEMILETVSYRKVLDAERIAEDVHASNIAEEKFFEKDNQSDNEHCTKTVLIFCGKGNNGGDGFVAARVLCNAGYDVTVVLVDGMPVTDDSKTNFKLIEDMSVNIVDMTLNKRALIELKPAPDIIIDAIYGTGFRGKLEGNALKAAIYMNRFSESLRRVSGWAETMIFALDIPSGLAGDMIKENEPDRIGVKAHCTIVFHAKKPVHLQDFAAEYCGSIIVADIGIDEERLWNVEIS